MKHWPTKFCYLIAGGFLLAARVAEMHSLVTAMYFGIFFAAILVGAGLTLLSLEGKSNGKIPTNERRQEQGREVTTEECKSFRWPEGL
jgi:hypothetical protein